MESFTSIAAAVAGGGLIATLAGVILGVRSFRTARLISSTPPTPIAQLDAGLHEVKGTLGADALVESPYAHRQCLYWHLLVEQRRKNRWQPLIDRSEAAPAWVDDGSGRARLDLAKAQVVVSAPPRVTSGIFGVPSAELDELLARFGVSGSDVQGPFLRYREEILEAGSRVYVVAAAARGEAGWELAERDEVFVVSDRDETEVVRHQQRAGTRWIGLAIAGVAACAAGAWLYVGI